MEEFDKEFNRIYQECMGYKKGTISLSKTPSSHETLPSLLRDMATNIILDRQSQIILDNTELLTLWNLLLKYKSSPSIENEHFISYPNFCEVKLEAPEKIKHFFTATIYGKLIQNDILSRVSIRTFFNYVMHKSWLNHSRISLSIHDTSGQGNLREQSLENYIIDLIPTLSQLKQIQSQFKAYYLHTVIRKFFFFLDPYRIGRIRISDVLSSGFLDDIVELREQDLSENQLSANWFSPQNALRIYSSYLQLDEDKNGMLNRKELLGYGRGILTEEFIERVFQEFLTYSGEMDYKSYLDFVLAMENKKEPQSIAYFFKCLDIGGQGKLTSVVIKHFYDGIVKRHKQTGAKDIVSFEDILNEIFDMVRPENPSYITLNDLLKSGKGETVINILTDLQGFYLYENREAVTGDFLEEAEL